MTVLVIDDQVLRVADSAWKASNEERAVREQLGTAWCRDGRGKADLVVEPQLYDTVEYKWAGRPDIIRARAGPCVLDVTARLRPDTLQHIGVRVAQCRRNWETPTSGRRVFDRIVLN